MNRLSGETSPYLLQHAHNPVEWYPWGGEALEKAKAEDKPILVSIGYSACHWCHVMERESFENETTARFMNEHFVNIKIDREERPDLDQIYMDAVQAMSGSGGWPLNVFLTPAGKPFYGGTYFPPVRMHNRASWTEVLSGIASAFRQSRDQIEEQADQLTDHIRQANKFGTTPLNFQVPAEERFTASQPEQAFEQVMKQADRQWGGFGRAPKFPQTFTIRFLLRYYWFSGKQEALQQALLSLDKMMMGGIYDHIGGGFARYSTDNEWLAPHFEKMLYDNALLVSVFCEAFQITREARYEKLIRETLRFVETELMSPEFGFYSALDADSEGVEGKYYVWTREDVEKILGEDATLFCRVYDITDQGNWEHVNIPRLLRWPGDLVAAGELGPGDLEKLETARVKLAKARSERVKPGLDDKILLSWNAMMNKAFSLSAMVLADEHFREVAERNMDFMFRAFRGDDGRMMHTYKNGIARVNAFLDDYANLAEAMFALYELSGSAEYLGRAKAIVEETVNRFSDEEGLFFYYTRDDQDDVLVRKKEIYDGATPSGNSVMANVLLHAGILYERVDWQERARNMAESVSQMAIRYPTSFGIWADLVQELVHGTLEVAVVGEGAQKAGAEVLSEVFMPYKVFQSSEITNEEFPLLRGKGEDGRTGFFLCRDYSCRKPVYEKAEFVQLIEKEWGAKAN